MPSELARRKYCSKDCVGASRRGKRKTEWVQIACKTCGTMFEVTPAWERNGRRRYCSTACRSKAHRPDRTGKVHTPAARKKMADAATGKFLRENSSQWKGGKHLKNGYTFVMIDVLPPDSQAMARLMTKGKYIAEHRIVAAMIEGRPLQTDEVVHHVNGEKSDNRPENLIVTRRADHSMEHREIERRFRMLLAEVEKLRAENADLRSRLS